MLTAMHRALCPSAAMYSSLPDRPPEEKRNVGIQKLSRLPESGTSAPSTMIRQETSPSLPRTSSIPLCLIDRKFIESTSASSLISGSEMYSFAVSSIHSSSI